MSRSNNPGRKDFAKPVPSNNAGQGDLLLQAPNDKLNPSAGSDYVEKRQWQDRSRNRDTAFVAAWETSQWWGHVQGQTRLIGRSVRRLSYQWMLLRRFCSASAQPKNLWITRTAKVMGWGTQAFHDAWSQGILAWSGTARGLYMGQHGSRSWLRGFFFPLWSKDDEGVRGTANFTWGVIFESSKLKARTSLLPRFSEKRLRALSFQPRNIIRKCHPKWDQLYH